MGWILPSENAPRLQPVFSQPKGSNGAESLDAKDVVPDRLRIAVTVDPEIPVPPKHYGGIERIVEMLVNGLIARGHRVTLFAHSSSSVPCRLIPYSSARHYGASQFVRNMIDITFELRSGRYDLIHSFGRLGYLLPMLRAPVPKIMSYQRTITDRSVFWGTRLSRGTLHFTGCSRSLISRWDNRRNWHVVYNGVPMNRYTPRYEVSGDAPLLFVGRLERIKGVHMAIDVARRSARRLIIAGNVPDGEEHRHFFETQIEPQLDGSTVTYMGPVDDADKNRLLGQAAALLMPVLWDEPFGIVMAEALACGTPVVGLNRGAIPEVIEDGVNGYVCSTPEEMVFAVSKIDQLDRRTCRRVMEDRFSDRAVVGGYESLYRQVLAEARAS